MAGHHGRGGKAVGHAGGQLIHPVSAGGISQEVHTIGVDAFGGDKRFDQAIEQIVDVALVPQVPRVGGGAGGDVNAFVEGVQLDLIAPLLVVDSRWCAAAAVHRDPQTPLALGGFAKITTQVLEGVVACGERFFFQLSRSLFGQSILALSHHALGKTIGLVFGEAHFIPHQIHQQFARRRGPSRRSAGVLPFPHRDGQQGFGFDFKAGHVVHVRSPRSGALAAVVLERIGHGDGKRHAFASGRLANPNRNKGPTLGGFFFWGGVPRGDVFAANGSAFGIPRHGEVPIDGFPTGGPHAEDRIARDRFARRSGEPTTVKALGVVLISAKESPTFTIVDFHPSVVAPLVVPIGHARRPRGDADTAAGIDEQNGQASAGGHALFDGFAGALVGGATFGVVVHVDQVEEFAVQGLRGFGRGGARGHQRRAAFKQVGPPRLAAFIEDGVGQDVVQEPLFRKMLGPSEGGPCLHRKVEVFDQQFGRQFLVVAWCVLLQKRRRSASQVAVFGFSVLRKGLP